MAYTFTVEDGTIVADANSYCDLQHAKDYHEAQIHSPAEWAAADDASKQKALTNATYLIQAFFTFPGRITDETQALSWPRYGVKRDYGPYLYGENEMPKILKDATAHLAGQILATDPEASQDQEAIKKLGLGKGALDVEFRDNVNPKHIAKLVAAMLDPIATWMESTSKVVSLRRV